MDLHFIPKSKILPSKLQITGWRVSCHPSNDQQIKKSNLMLYFSIYLLSDTWYLLIGRENKIILDIIGISNVEY